MSLYRMTPLASMIQSDGQDRTPYFREIVPPGPAGPFQNDRQVIRSSASLDFRPCRSSSLFTPIRANGLPSIFFTSDRSYGYMARHGGHQSPQKSRRTTFPR